MSDWLDRLEKLREMQAVQKSETPPHPDNRAVNVAWFNREFTIDGEYKPSDGENCGIVAANVNWLSRSLMQVPLKLYAGFGSEREITKHPVLDLLRRPNSRHSYKDLLYGLIRSLVVSGDGPLEILEPLGLQVVPYQWLRQKLSNYQFDNPQYWMQTFTDARYIDPDKVVNLMWRPYDRNQTIGESPLVAVYAEIILDRTAMEGAVGRLSSPIVGVALAPKELDAQPITDQEKQELKDQADQLRGHNAGQLMLVEGRFEIKELHGNVTRFSYKEFHDVAESRISGVLGIHPRVLYLGAGLQQSQGIGSSMESEIRLSWENGAKPMAHLIADGLTRHLLPKLGYDGLELRFDFSALDFESEEQKTMRSNRIREDLAAGIIKDTAEARMLIGYE